MRPLSLVFALSALALSTPAMADAIILEASGARAEGRWGLEFGGGYQIDVGPLAFRPIVGGFVHGDRDDRFARETLASGAEVCRDTSSGFLTERSECRGTGVRAYGKLEAVARIPLFGELGVGARISADNPRVYGTAAFPILPGARVKANVGDRYLALGVQAGF